MALISWMKTLFALCLQLICGLGIAVSMYWMSLYKIVQVDSEIWAILFITYATRNSFVGACKSAKINARVKD